MFLLEYSRPMKPKSYSFEMEACCLFGALHHDGITRDQRNRREAPDENTKGRKRNNCSSVGWSSPHSCA